MQKGGHDIPAEDVKRRFETLLKDLAAVFRTVTKAVFYDNENGFKEVAEYRNGEITTKGEPLPKWITELSEYLKTDM